MQSKTAILCDIDGVLVDAQPLYEKVDNEISGEVGAEHHKLYDSIAEQAKLATAGIRLVKILWFNGQHRMFFITSRSETIREKTLQLLYDNGMFIDQEQLLMRIEPYEVPSQDVKRRQIKSIRDMGYRPILMIDDSTVNCKTAFDAGIPAIRVQCITQDSYHLIP